MPFWASCADYVAKEVKMNCKKSRDRGKRSAAGKDKAKHSDSQRKAEVVANHVVPPAPPYEVIGSVASDKIRDHNESVNIRQHRSRYDEKSIPLSNRCGIGDRPPKQEMRC